MSQMQPEIAPNSLLSLQSYRRLRSFWFGIRRVANILARVQATSHCQDAVNQTDFTSPPGYEASFIAPNLHASPARPDPRADHIIGNLTFTPTSPQSFVLETTPNNDLNNLESFQSPVQMV